MSEDYSEDQDDDAEQDELQDVDKNHAEEEEKAPPKAVRLDFDDEAGETMQQKKTKRFEEFKQRRERAELQRKQRTASRDDRIVRMAAKTEADEQQNGPNTQQLTEKNKASDLHTNDHFAKPQRTPGVRQANPK